MRLSGEAFRTVSSALADAFSDRGQFERLARCIEKQLQDICGPDATNPEIVLALIECSETEDALAGLISCAKELNSTNVRLAAIDVDSLGQAAPTTQVVEGGGGTDDFKHRLLDALGTARSAGLEALAGKELADLLKAATDAEAETLFLALLGTVRTEISDAAASALAPVVSESLRRRIGDGKRPDDLKVDLTRTRLRRIDLSGLDLHQADIAFADLRHANLESTNLWRSRAYGVNASEVGLSRSNLEEARWHEAVARETRFHDCRMVSAFFKDADLAGAEFQRSRLQGAHFERADLSGTDFEQAQLTDTYFAGATIDEAAARSIARAFNWQEAHLDPPALELVKRFAGP